MKYNLMLLWSTVFFMYAFSKNFLDMSNIMRIYQSIRSEQPQIFTVLPHRFQANIPPDDTNFKNVLMEPLSALSDEIPQYFITVLVKSEPQNVDRRNTIRSTWGSVSSVENMAICVIFITGTLPRGQSRLKEEGEKFGDILQIDIEDEFMNQPEKFLAAFQWLSENFAARSNFYVATKDNCVINFARTVEFLLKHPAEMSNAIHCGYMFENNTGIIRGSGPRSISKESYPDEIYPMFCREQMVVLTIFHIKQIYTTSTVTDISNFPLYDVLLYGILREKANIDIFNIKNGGFPLMFDPWDESVQVVKKMILKWNDWISDLNSISVHFKN